MSDHAASAPWDGVRDGFAQTVFAFQRIGSRAMALSIALVITPSIASLSGCASTSAAGDSPSPLTLDQIKAIVASPDRSAPDRTNDVRRRPVDMLDFIGVRPGMIALDVSAGGGYTTELIARAVGSTGRVYGQSALPNPDRAAPAAPEGASAPPTAATAPVATAASTPSTPPASTPRRTSAMALAERAKNPNVSNIIAVVRPFEDPAPPTLAKASFDLVTLMFNYHDMGHMGVDRAAMNKAIYAALKPGGTYVIADHAGRQGTGISESGTLHRVEEDFVIREVSDAGFKFVEEGVFLRNPNDPRDRNTPDPPQPKDEFVVKFVKP